ncbi:MAG: hypothetical protein RLZZ383_2907 [Pseudomonadota bacterium]
MRWTMAWVLVGMVGCGVLPDGASDTSDSSDTGDGTNIDSSLPEDTGGTPAETDPVELPSLRVTVRDVAQVILTEGVNVQYCRTGTCFRPTRDGDTFAFFGLGPGTGSLEVIDARPMADRATVFAPIVLGDTPRELSVEQPTVSASAILPAQRAELELGNLLITVGAGELTPADAFTDPSIDISATLATSVALPIENGPSNELVALWYMNPFNHTNVDPMPIRFMNTWGAADGQLSLWQANYGSSDWTRLADLVVDGEGYLAPQGIAGIYTISTLAVFRN